ncbi:hypothetical protein HHI36_004478, partial [Cryptolaemus montrouzieri]
MAAAIAAVIEKKMGYLNATSMFPGRQSVTDKGCPIEAIINKAIGRQPIFGQEIENLLMEYVLTMA